MLVGGTFERDSLAMMIPLIAVLAAVSLAAPANPASLHRIPHPRKHRQAKTSVAGSAATRRERLVLLALQQEMLHDFLVEAGTERPAFEDARVVTVADHVKVGPTFADVDFLGSPIVRTEVRNSTSRIADLLVTAEIAGAGDRQGEVSAAVERLLPGESRRVELFCPSVLTPTSIAWRVTIL
jgi:hypothetical protein